MHSRGYYWYNASSENNDWLVFFHFYAHSKGFNEKFDKAYSKSSGILTESISNVRTMASLTLEERFILKFFTSLKEPYRAGIASNFLYLLSKV